MPSASAAAETLPSLRASARCTAARSAWSRQPRRPRRADNEIVGIDRDQPAAAAIDIGCKQKAGVRERQPELLHLDPARGIADGNRNEIDETFREVGAAGGYVERRG